MNRRVFIGTVAGGLLAAPLAAEAQQAGKVYRIGYLTVPSRATAQGVADKFQHGLRDLGWIDGQNIVVNYRFVDSNVNRVPDLAAEPVRFRADVMPRMRPGRLPSSCS
jgi:putative ABC transport system substrate-binding protein